MHSSTSHIFDLVRNLLDFHSIEKEQPQITSIAFLPSLIIHNIYDSFLPLAQKKKINFEMESTLTESKVFLSDPYYIRQIVNNLLSNAIKFTPEQSRILLTTSIDDQNHWTISVKDSGPGIDSEDQAKVFDEFVRLSKTSKEVEGTGLGLTISKKLANMLGGTIELESQIDAGCNFTLTIPLSPVKEDTFLQYNALSDTSSVQILFVDDDKVQLNLLSEIMKKENLSYVCCSSAFEALSTLQKKPFDIIFTDIHIPDMEGLELIKRIRELGNPQIATIPIIAFSAGSQKTESELIAAGFSGFLLKPFNVQQLIETIEIHTSHKGKTDEIDQENDKFGWQKIMAFVSSDHEAAMKVIDSFIEETNKDKEVLKNAFKKKDKEAIKQVSHKMLTLLKMVSDQEIISILTDFENGNITKEKKETFFPLLEETIEDAEAMKKEVVMNYTL